MKKKKKSGIQNVYILFTYDRTCDSRSRGWIYFAQKRASKRDPRLGSQFTKNELCSHKDPLITMYVFNFVIRPCRHGRTPRLLMLCLLVLVFLLCAHFLVSLYPKTQKKGNVNVGKMWTPNKIIFVSTFLNHIHKIDTTQRRRGERTHPYPAHPSPPTTTTTASTTPLPPITHLYSLSELGSKCTTKCA